MQPTMPLGKIWNPSWLGRKTSCSGVAALSGSARSIRGLSNCTENGLPMPPLHLCTGAMVASIPAIANEPACDSKSVNPGAK